MSFFLSSLLLGDKHPKLGQPWAGALLAGGRAGRLDHLEPGTEFKWERDSLGLGSASSGCGGSKKEL